MAHAWFLAAASQGVRLQVLLSSYSARADADSEYGLTKFEMERTFQTVLRPGLVMGDGGLYRKQQAALRRLPIVPVIGDGQQPTAVIRMEHFLEAATRVIEEERAGAFNLFYEKQPSYRELVRAMKAGQRTIFLPIPAALALGLAGAAEALHLPLPVKPSQIRALLANQSAPWHSDLANLLPGQCDRPPGLFEWAFGPRNPMKNSMPEVGHASACQPAVRPGGFSTLSPSRPRRPQFLPRRHCQKAGDSILCRPCQSIPSAGSVTHLPTQP